MNAMSGQANHDPSGLVIGDYRVIGEGRDGQGHWIEADVLVDIHPAGRFLLTIVTKQQFANERISRVYQDIEDVDIIEDLIGEGAIERRIPFVLNDTEITEEVIERKFKNRKVETDLANSLWYEGPVDSHS